jgi:hypothetical protein
MRLCPPHLAVNTPASLYEVTFWSDLLASTVTNHFIWDANVFDEFLKRNSGIWLRRHRVNPNIALTAK